ncbi:hypothetical protein PI125_g16568 [Phytophthora idaei]|nr:hypothetical protein PI125_g16568 [Phytophthora idaei]
MHSHRADRDAIRSSDAIFVFDFDRNAAPRTSPPCTTYYGSLDSVQGLTAFANAQWYELTTHALYRVREVVVANMDAHLAQSPRPVQRKLHDVKQLLEAPFAHLSIDYPLRWCGGGLYRRRAG